MAGLTEVTEKISTGSSSKSNADFFQQFWKSNGFSLVGAAPRDLSYRDSKIYQRVSKFLSNRRFDGTAREVWERVGGLVNVLAANFSLDYIWKNNIPVSSVQYKVGKDDPIDIIYGIPLLFGKVTEIPVYGEDELLFYVDKSLVDVEIFRPSAMSMRYITQFGYDINGKSLDLLMAPLNELNE